MMAHYLRHNHQATANRALCFPSLPFPCLFQLFPSFTFYCHAPNLHPDFSRVVLIVETDAIFPVCRNLLHRQD